MIKNWNHDLVQQLSETSDSLWRMEDYVKNAEGCGQCAAMWKDAREKFEQVSTMLINEINHHSKESRFE